MFINRLKEVMDEKSVTAYRLSKDIGMSASLITKWEKKPDIEPSALKALSIAEYFQLNLKWLLTGNGEKYSLSQQPPEQSEEDKDKIRLLENYSKLTDLEKTKLLGISFQLLPSIIDELETIKKTSTKQANKVNDNVVSMNKSIYDSNEEKIVEIKMYHQSASAGIGNPFIGDSDYDILHFDDKDIPHNADCIIKISGDSMYPTFNDGDMVWVREGRSNISSGDIGIFVLDNDSLCKRYEPNHDDEIIELVSDNEKYSPIRVDEYRELLIVGKVLSKVDEAIF